jgi:murein DD-endopeptidase MepM/ murein hydrolase activator NlpD
MSKKEKAKKILVEITIPLLKTLIFVRRVVGGTLHLAVFKPLKFTFRSLLYKPTVKAYGLYILFLKRFREIGQKKNSKSYLTKKLSVPTTISVIALVVVGISLFGQPSKGELTNKMYSATAAKLVKSDFETITADELITETALPNIICAPTVNNYISGEALSSAPKINTKTTITNETTNANCLSLNNEAIVSIGGINTQKGEAERTGIVTYIVKIGENINTIARDFGITTNTIIWANNLSSSGKVQIGQTLKILPTSGVLHQVVAGETLDRIAAKYKISKEKIIEMNGLGDGALVVKGEKLIIPGGKKIVTSVATTSKVPGQSSTSKPSGVSPSGSTMQWPTVGYRITQYYSWRHTGLDIGNKVGTPLYAAEDGVVEVSGWNSGGYGYMVLIRHASGVKTRYAHASKLYVSSGQTVKRGEVIALMGSTGRSTGPHIHFEVIINGTRVNPLNYIR